MKDGAVEADFEPSEEMNLKEETKKDVESMFLNEKELLSGIESLDPSESSIEREKDSISGSGDEEKGKLIEDEDTDTSLGFYSLFKQYFRLCFSPFMAVLCGILFVSTEISNVYYARCVQLWMSDSLG